MPQKANATLQLFNVLGQPLLIQNTALEAGKNRVSVEIGDLPKGLYLYRVQVGEDFVKGWLSVF